MKRNQDKAKQHTLFTISATLLVGGAIGAWTLMALIASLNQVDWNFYKLYEQYLIATNQVIPEFSLSELSIIISSSTSELILYLTLLVCFFVFFRYCKRETNTSL